MCQKRFKDKHQVMYLSELQCKPHWRGGGGEEIELLLRLFFSHMFHPGAQIIGQITHSGKILSCFVIYFDFKYLLVENLPVKCPRVGTKK